MPTVEHTESTWELKEADEWLPGVIDSIVDGDPHPQYGASVKFIVHLEDDVDPISEEPRETWAFASAKLSKKSKLFGWVKAIDASLIPEEGGTLDLSVLDGRPVEVMFENYTKDDGTEAQKIVKIRGSKSSDMKTKQKRAAAAAKPKPQPQVEEDDDELF